MNLSALRFYIALFLFAAFGWLAGYGFSFLCYVIYKAIAN